MSEFPRAKRFDESLVDYHNAFFGAMLAECQAAGLRCELTPDEELGQRITLTGDEYKSPRKQRAAARLVGDIYERLSGRAATMVYQPNGTSKDTQP